MILIRFFVLFMCIHAIVSVPAVSIEVRETQTHHIISQWHKKTEPITNSPRHITNVKNNCNKGESYSKIFKKCSILIQPI